MSWQHLLEAMLALKWCNRITFVLYYNSEIVTVILNADDAYQVSEIYPCFLSESSGALT